MAILPQHEHGPLASFLRRTDPRHAARREIRRPRANKRYVTVTEGQEHLGVGIVLRSSPALGADALFKACERQLGHRRIGSWSTPTLIVAGDFDALSTAAFCSGVSGASALRLVRICLQFSRSRVTLAPTCFSRCSRSSILRFGIDTTSEAVVPSFSVLDLPKSREMRAWMREVCSGALLMMTCSISAS